MEFVGIAEDFRIGRRVWDRPAEVKGVKVGMIGWGVMESHDASEIHARPRRGQCPERVIPEQERITLYFSTHPTLSYLSLASDTPVVSGCMCIGMALLEAP